MVFQYRNGEKADETTMTISLINGNDTYIVSLVARIRIAGIVRTPC
jgi:hypothetical protein